MDNIQRILVPIDFSASSRSALERGVNLANKYNATLHLLHVVSDLHAEDEQERLKRRAEDAILSVLDAESEVELETVKRVVFGQYAAAITQYAREQRIDAIVMGTNGRSGIARLALGSVAERVLRTAPCPVMVTRVQGEPTTMDEETEALNRTQSPAIELLARARQLRATDIHHDPVEGGHRVRLRIDGRIENYCTLDTTIADHLINQYKTLADLDIADPFEPQEGRLRLPESMSDMEVRITTSPVTGGEAVALRLFARATVFLPIDSLGLSTNASDLIDSMLRKGEGLVLITGPTGSGKTTTIYSMLSSLSSIEQNIVSIEDPVEFCVSFVRQMNVDERHGVDMSTGLRTMLRMDPDVVFLGEIRDATAADITMRASSSGRYVLSTLHTRDVASTVTALRDLKINNRSIAANLNGIINQRLVRRLCEICRRPVPTTDAQRQRFESLQIPIPETLYEAAGCKDCRSTGYRGRIGIFEAATIDDEVAEAIASGESEAHLRACLHQRGMNPLLADAFEKVAAGITDEMEASRVHWLT